MTLELFRNLIFVEKTINPRNSLFQYFRIFAEFRVPWNSEKNTERKKRNSDDFRHFFFQGKRIFLLTEFRGITETEIPIQRMPCLHSFLLSSVKNHEVKKVTQILKAWLYILTFFNALQYCKYFFHFYCYSYLKWFGNYVGKALFYRVAKGSNCFQECYNISFT